MTLQFGWWDHFEQRSDMPLWQQYDERIELIRHAEELGFYGYHIAEHHFTTLDMAPSPIVFLAAVARRTTKIRLGTMVLCLPLYHPTRLIQEFCMIDQLSHGRFMPGVGRGVRDPEHELFGSELATMRETYEEVLAILQQGLEHGPHHASRQALPVRRRAGAFRDGAEAVSALLVCRQPATRGGAGDERARPRDTRHDRGILADLGGRSRAQRSPLPGRGSAGRLDAAHRHCRERRGGGVARPPRVRRLCRAFPLHRSAVGSARQSRRAADAGRRQLRDDARGGAGAGRLRRHGARHIAALPGDGRAEAQLPVRRVPVGRSDHARRRAVRSICLPRK